MTAGRSILVTGCSSGIGRAAALELKKQGWRVFAAVRNVADRGALEAEGLEAVRLDYTDPISIRFALDTILSRTGGRLDALFNNGGYSQMGALEDLPTDLLRAQFETNVFGWHELIRRVVPIMRAQGSGRIVQCSSVLGFVGGKYRGAYSASKHAVEGLSDVLRLELAGSGIDVVLIEPGPIRSAFLARALANFIRTIDVDGSHHRVAYRKRIERLRKAGDAGRFKLPPEAVVEALVKALDAPRPKARYRVTTPAKIAWALKRLLPTSLLDRVIAEQ